MRASGRSGILAGVLFLVAAAAASAAGASGARTDYPFIVVINRSNPDSVMTRRALTDLFLKHVRQWDRGLDALPVDLPADSDIRQEFSRDVLERDMSAVMGYWRSQIFSGRGVPPPELATPALVVSYVAANPGAIGYIPRDDADTLPAGVKTLRIDE